MAKKKSAPGGRPAEKGGKSIDKKAGTAAGHRGAGGESAQVSLNERETPVFQLLVIAFWTAVIITLVRMMPYTTYMEQFFWSSSGDGQEVDFFSYVKMVAILITAGLVVLILLYRFMTQTFTFKKCFAYIPMLVYAAMVLLSYGLSDYKEFALWGWNERFEGTPVLLAYMLLLFFIINSVNTERCVKWVVYPVAGAACLLGLLGLSQYLDMDFFQTALGKKLILPPAYWEMADTLEFTFQNREIYQTVYNINYVSFYLSLLVPLFFMVFLYQKALKWQLVWGAVFALSMVNLVGSKSAGGIMGLGFAFLLGIIICNKRLWDWRKPLAVLLVIIVAAGAITSSTWIPEVSSAVRGVLGGAQTTASAEEEDTAAAEAGSLIPTIDYFITAGDSVTVSINGEPLTVSFQVSDNAVQAILVTDSEGESLGLSAVEESGLYTIDDPRFYPYLILGNGASSDGSRLYLLLDTPDRRWAFQYTDDGFYYENDLGELVALYDVPWSGWADNPGMGSGRGYIWSRTLPLLADTLFIGKGADTYCIYFPHEDYAGKYSAWGSDDVNLIVDKPHNMYMGIMVGTGGVSLLALLALWGIYLVQSCRLYFCRKPESFTEYAGMGIFFGVFAFLVSAIVDDSSVSVMPLFYGLLGAGVAINLMLQKARKPLKSVEEKPAA
ncbi:MAG: O-antigen ligase family protein [Bacillota bacterium]|nr:O-antigen ligase family protein [Bacillota bacterium]